MAFKSDASFLDKISMGAAGTRKVLEYLNRRGHNIIELERYSMSNKIWATKIKRFRVPDLLCLKCGQRIESRAKSKLEIKMSDSPTNPNRHWDYGLRSDDLVALIHCSRAQEGTPWIPSDNVNLFSLRNLRATLDQSKLGAAKSAGEGAERDRTWPSWTPKRDGEVVSIENDAIRVVWDSGRKYTYSLKDKPASYVHVKAGDRFSGESLIAASVVPWKEEGRCRRDHYDFLSDTYSNSQETVYCATKALGHLSELKENSVPVLTNLARTHPSELIRLESAGALARLDEALGWDLLDTTLKNDRIRQEIRMEAILIVGELTHGRSLDILQSVAADRNNEAELRAAAVWSMASNGTQSLRYLLSHVDDDETDVALHSMIAASRVLHDGDVRNNVCMVLQQIGPNHRKSAACIKVLSRQESPDVISEVVRFLVTAQGEKRGWLLYLVGLWGADLTKEELQSFGEIGQEISNELDIFWKFHKDNWTNNFAVEEGLMFLQRQN